MPMDYDDNDFNIHNVDLGGEGSSTVSPVLRPYDYEDGGHLRFDSLVENEVFLGITGQEDNQWIEEYSRGTNSSESRRNNVWSEATSSESVEMLLKSVGEGALVTEELDLSDEPGYVATNMDPILKQDDENNYAREAMVTNKEQEGALGETVNEYLDEEPGSLTKNTVPNLNQDDEKNHAQEAMITNKGEGTLVTGELDASDEPGSLTTLMDPNLKQDEDGNNLAQEAMITNKHQDNFSGSNASFDCDKFHVTITTQSQEEVKVSGGELGSDVLGKKCDLSEEKVDNICDDVNQEAKDITVEDKLQEDLSTSTKRECGDTHASKACGLTKSSSSSNEAECSTCKNMDNHIGCSHTAVETCTNSNDDDEKPSNVDKPPFEDVNEEEPMPVEAVAGSCNMIEACAQQLSHDSSECAAAASPIRSEEARELIMHDDDSPAVAVEDDHDNTKSEIFLPQTKSNVTSPLNGSDATPSAFDPSEIGEGNSLYDVGTNTFSSAELLAGNTDLVACPKAKLSVSQQQQQQVNDEIQSLSDQGMDRDVTFDEGGNARLPWDSNGTDIEVVAVLDTQKHVESTSSAEADITHILAEPVAAVRSELVSSPDASDGAHLHSGSVAIDDAKSPPILEGVSSVQHQVNEEKKEEGFVSDNGTKVATSMVEKVASPDHAGEVVHGMSVENINEIMNEQAKEANTLDPIPCGDVSSSAKVGDNVEAGDPKESISEQHHSEAPPLSLAVDFAVNLSSEQQASTDVVPTSECDDSHMRHDEDSSSVSMDILQSVVNTELSQSTKVTPCKMDEGASLPEATDDVEGKEQSVSDKTFTFEVSATAGLGETDKGLLLFPAIQACNLSANMEGPCIDSSSSMLDHRKPADETPVAIPKTPCSGTPQVLATKERKTRRKSVGKESVKKDKETTPRQSGRVEKSSPLLFTTASTAGHVIQFQELKPKEKVECSLTKPIPTSNLPDLNNATSIFHQPFTDNQQVQLRAQILVYGSLISGTPPEEPHMIAAFGQSDAGRKTWEAAWHACLERVCRQKSQADTPPMQQPRSDVGHITPDLEIKHSSSLPSKVVSSSPSNKGTPPAVSPFPSPLWNLSTPSCVARSVAAFRQSFSPLHPTPYQTPPAGHNPPWLSQGPFPGQFASSSPASAFNAAPRFSSLPITEAVKLTPLKVSHTYSRPVVHSAALSTDGKKATVSSGQASSKSRKRKKVTTAVSQALMAAPPIAHLPHTNHIPFLVENQTDSVTAPIVTSVFSTAVTVSTPPASKSSSPARFFSLSSTPNHPRFGDKNAEDMLLKKVEEVNVNATKTSSDSRSTKRKKVSTSPFVNQTPVSTLAPPVLPQIHLGSETLLLAQNQTNSVTAPASFPTSPVSISTSKTSPTGRFLKTIYPTHGYPRTGFQNMEVAHHLAAVEETMSKVKESKLQAENVALLAADEVSNCQVVWNQKDSGGVVSDAEAKLISSIAAAATVAKMAAAAAKIASDVAEQGRLMADEVFLSNKTETCDQSSSINVVNKAATILKSVDKSINSHPNSIISAAREAARRRIEAASAASKHAENLDAIVKAAELAAEAVSQVGKIVAMGDSSTLRKLAEAGPEGFWKTSSQLPEYDQQQQEGGEISGHPNGKKNTPNVFIEEIRTVKNGLAPPVPVHLAHNQMMMMIDDTGNEKDARAPTEVAHLSKSIAVGQNIPENTSGIWEEHNIREGCLIEVYKEDGKYKGAWLAANVLSLKDKRALVCYTNEIQSSDEGSEKLKEWVALEVEGSEEEVPRIRVAHPMTTMRFEGARKRRRTAVTDYAWSNGDRVDVWMQDCWREGVVMEPNEIDVTSLTVQFPAAQGETSIVRSWHVRPTLIWKDRKWIEWKGGRASQGEMPKEKRMKLGSPAVNDNKKNVVVSRRHEEQGTLPLLSVQESSFNVGKSTDKLSSNLKTIKSGGLHKEGGARVIFGVPKPGKKQKFMDVSTHYVDADGSNKNNTTNGSFRFSRYLKPQAASPGWKTNSSKSDPPVENQVMETKSRLKSRKPPVPSFRTISHNNKDNNSTRDSEITDADSVSDVENYLSSRQNQTQVVGSSSSNNKKRRDAKKAFSFTSKPKSEHHFNKKGGKLQLLAAAPAADAKVGVKDSQVNEPRRSNRKIQPTSRLLEGLQSSLTISKMPSVSHASQRKITSKGTTNHG